MNDIIPAIIPASAQHLGDSLTTILPFTHEVQIDIVDGIFVPFTSWPYIEGASQDDLALLIRDFQVEVDLMIQNPENSIEDYLHAGVQKVVIHLESTTDVSTVLAYKNSYNFALGLSISNETPIDVLIAQIGVADYVQLMGIRNIGSQGQPFDELVLDRIREIKSQYPHMLISVDGSVQSETIPLLREAGAARFVAGSAIFGNANPYAAYEVLTHV